MVCSSNQVHVRLTVWMWKRKCSKFPQKKKGPESSLFAAFLEATGTEATPASGLFPLLPPTIETREEKNPL